MALVTKRIYRIVDDLANLNPAQIGIDATPDADLGFKMWGGKDELGTVTKWLAKGYAGSLSTLTLTGGTTTGDLGILKHDVGGGVSGGQLTVSQFNNYISDGGFLWTRDAVNGKVIPLTNTDKVQAGDGTAATPGFTFDGNPTSGLYLGNIIGVNSGVGVAHGGVAMAGFGVVSGASTMVCAPDLAFKILHQWDTASGVNTMSIENNATQTGIESHLTISCTAVNALNDITIDSQELIFNAYNNMDFTADLGTITIQAQGVTLGGIVNEADWFEFQNYTAYSPIPVWNSNAQWAAYEATFGVSYPILQAMVDLTSAGAHNSLTGIQGGDGAGGGERYHLTADEYSDLRDNLPVVGGRVFYSGAGGELSANQYLTWDYTNMYLSAYDTGGTNYVRLNHDGTYGRVSTNSAAIALGTETTSHVLNANGDLVTRKLEVNNNLYIDGAIVMDDDIRQYIGSVTHRSVFLLSTAQTNDSFLWTVNSAKSISIIDETYITSDFGLASQSHPSLFVFSSTNPATDANQYGYFTNTTSNFVIGSGKGFISFDDSVLIDIGGSGYTPYSVDATTPDTFTFNPDNGLYQRVTIDANTTFTLVAPTGGNTRTTVVIDNTDVSSHNIDFEYSGQNDTVHYVPSSVVTDTSTNITVICAAGELTVITIMWNHNDGTDDHWIVSASPTTEIEIGAPV